MLNRSPAMDPSRPLPLPPPNPAMPYREDCWSEGATSALIDAWGDRYIELNRGNLRQKDWQEVADTVNSRRGARRPPRTDSQCKNRIDTLKKKYKAEKARIASGASFQSQWPFYPRLDTLIGASPVAGGGTPGKKPMSPSLPLALPIPSHRKPSPLPAARPVEPLRRHTPPTSLPTNGSYQRNYSAAAAAAAAAAYDSGSSASSSGDRLVRSLSPPPRMLIKRAKVEREDDEGEVDMVQQLVMGRRIKRAKVECEDDEGEVDVVRQLAMAIDRFTEVYEKLERNRQRDMMELEMQRIEFLKGLEYQRLQMFVDLQVKLQEIKCSRRVDAGWICLDEAGNQFKRARQAVQD